MNTWHIDIIAVTYNKRIEHAYRVFNSEWQPKKYNLVAVVAVVFGEGWIRHDNHPKQVSFLKRHFCLLALDASLEPYCTATKLVWCDWWHERSFNNFIL